MATEAEHGGSGFNIHPMDQFEVHPLFGGTEVHWYTITNHTLWLALAVIARQPADGLGLARPGAGAVARPVGRRVDLRLHPQDDRGRRRAGRG